MHPDVEMRIDLPAKALDPSGPTGAHASELAMNSDPVDHEPGDFGFHTSEAH